MEKYKAANLIVQNLHHHILIEDFELESAVFSKIADAVPDMLYVTDIQQMRKIYSNTHIQHLFKMGSEEICEMGSRFFEKTVHPADQHRYFERMDILRKAKDNEVDELEYRIIDHEGKVRWLTTKRKVLTRDEYGKPLQIIGISQDITVQMDLNAERERLIEEQSKLKAVQQRRLFKAIINAQEEERRNIAETLHNEIGQLLFAAQLKLGASEAESRALINTAIKKVRQISFELTPVLLNDMGLEAALKDMLERKLDALNISFNFSFNIKENRLSSNMEVVLYRIVQELLNNTIKHAQATHVNVLILQKEEELYVSQTDNGKGMETSVLSNPKKGFGLKSVVNRLHLLNGVFEVFSKPNKGTKILMNIPLNGAE
ncbi:ATP-binding protein [Pedobacter xixiisoli]|uniref:histidine kinase n=1 Tax=Pedobacter xixiisoli TaxID=1476464 RepID=A0A285ZWZ0_9SPHI|nr:ATP-binding protein [Pedobacter xixiisoli]SOD14156.1 PAS domain S-box-containing protein [Pedobacter xixiisoli]